MVDTTTCNLHVCHNAIQKCSQVFGEDLSELVIILYIWFKLSSSSREDYEEVQKSLACRVINFERFCNGKISEFSVIENMVAIMFM